MSGIIVADQLRTLNPTLPEPRAQLFATVFDNTLDEGEITTPLRVRHFIAQVMQETGGLRGIIESTNYTNPERLDRLFNNVQGIEHARRLIAEGPIAIGNTIYANKNGNGGIDSGDGYRYRGRGFLQITGRGNYRSLGTLISMPLEDNPELLGEPEPAAKAAVMYWRVRRINTPADANDVDMVTQLVNGPARLHLAERRIWLEKAASVWEAPEERRIS
jgi:putative chitinase